MSSPEPKKIDKYDMFDVARGTCKFEDYLLIRFTQHELEKKIQVDPQASLQEYIAPPKPPPAPKPLFPPTPAAPQSLFPAAPTPSAPTPAEPTPAAPAPEPVDIQQLIAGFQQARQEYTKRANWDGSVDEPGTESNGQPE
jgi:hypothetical protein